MSWPIAAIVVDDATASVLVERGSGLRPGDVARLPIVELPDGRPTGEDLCAAVEGLLGRPIEPIWLRSSESDDRSESGMAAILTAADRAHDGAHGRAFVPAADVVDVLEPEMARAAVRAWLDRLGNRADARTPPWMEPGWFERVSGWIAERMAAAGFPPSERSRMTYQSPLGTIIRTRSRDRATYLKCSAPHFRAEASITHALASRTPAWIPEVIDIEATEGWLLMADLGDRILGREAEAGWVDGMRRVAEVQRAWVGGVEELVAAGAQRRPLADLTAAVPDLLDVDGLGERIAPALLERWPDLRRRFVDACRELEDLGLPDALIHGDPHPWNIAVTDHGLVLFDWSDGAAGPSFLDLAVFVRRTKDLALRRELRDAYVDAWSGVATRERLERACELAMAVGALYQVVTYQALLPALPPEDRVVYGTSDNGWFRASIDGLERGLDAVGLPA